MTDSLSVTTAYTDERVTLLHGDCIEAMRSMPDRSVDSIVCDPPYGLGFMGKAWDDLPPGLPWAQECLRVLKPGGHLLAFGGSRTWHRLAVAVEDAGFEIRDSIAWLYGSGFPKSMSVSLAIDKAAGAKREVIGMKRSGGASALTGNNADAGPTGDAWRYSGGVEKGFAPITVPATEAAQQWAGWGTALKPAFEPVVVGRKPLEGKTVAANVLLHGTGALNIDGSRIAAEPNADLNGGRHRGVSLGLDGSTFGAGINRQSSAAYVESAGRWPANVVLDEGQAAVLDAQSGYQKDGVAGGKARGFRTEYVGGEQKPSDMDSMGYGGGGGASRFFYCAKAPKSERPTVDGIAHPTVKPLSLMRYLVKLVTPPGGTVLDTFAGSGATVEAALLEDFNCIAVERETDYLPLILARVERYSLSVTAKADAEFDAWLQETLI